jgi:hypothetical protein
MGMVVAVVLAFAIGLAGMAGLQHVWLGAIKQRINAPSTQHAGFPVTKPVVTNIKIQPFTMPKMPPIDTRAAQAAWAHSHAHKIDIQIRNAQSYVPKPVHIPGMRR